MLFIILFDGLDGVDVLSICLFIWYDNCLIKVFGFFIFYIGKKKKV